MINFTDPRIDRIKKPIRWSVYTEPHINLLYAILLQAIEDSNGYYDSSNHKHFSGNDAKRFILQYGENILETLVNADKQPLSDWQVAKNKTKINKRLKIKGSVKL